jgi:L-iditol 2-dehydrogenase
MKAAVLHAVGDLRIEQAPTPRLSRHERACLVRVKYAGVCGSDIARVSKDGTYRMPLIPGHEFAGLVEQAGPDSPVKPGRLVAVYPLLPCFECTSCMDKQYPQCERYNYFGSRCDGGFAEYVKVPYFNLVPVPEGIPAETAALCEPASVAQHGLRTAGMSKGDSVLLFGSGAIGLMVVQWAQIMGAAEVTVVDIVEDKIAVARSLCPGATCINSARTDLKEALRDKRFSLCVEGTGTPGCYPQVVEYARNNGRVLLLGNPAKDVVLERATVSQVLRKQLTIHGTWNSTVGGPCNEWAETLKAVASGALNLGRLITHRYRLDDLIEALEMMRSGKEFYNRVLIEC